MCAGAVRSFNTFLVAVSVLASCPVDCTRPAQFGRGHGLKDAATVRSNRTYEASSLGASSRDKQCCCNSNKPNPKRKCEIHKWGCSERMGSFKVIQHLDLCEVKTLYTRIHKNIETAGWAVDQLWLHFKNVKSHYPVAAPVDKFRIQKADACTRKYKITKWPSELDGADEKGAGKDDSKGVGDQIKKKKKHIHVTKSVTKKKKHPFDNTAEEPEALLEVVSNSSVDHSLTSGSRSSGLKLCCCKIAFDDKNHKKGISESDLGVAESCKRQFKCQGKSSQFPQTTSELVCKFGDVMDRLKFAVAGLKGNAMDAERIYGNHPGWDAIDEAKGLKECLVQIHLPDLLSKLSQKGAGGKSYDEGELDDDDDDLLGSSAWGRSCFVLGATIPVLAAVLRAF